MPKNKAEKKPRKSFKEAFYAKREKVWDKKRARLKLHHSFKRSYREDYARGLEAPGLVAHAMSTLKILFKNWKIFGGLMIIIVLMNITFVGLMSEDTYQTVQDSIDESTEMLEYGEIGRVAKSGLLLISTVTTGGLTKGMTEVQQVFAFFFTAATILITIYYLRHLLAGNPRWNFFNFSRFFINKCPFIIYVIYWRVTVRVFAMVYITLWRR